MDNKANVKCPRCGNENVIIQNRGYSFSLGLGVSCLLIIADWIYTIGSNSAAFNAMDEAGQFGFTAGLLLKSVFIFFFGLFFGLIGKNKLVARCLNCKHKFDPALGIHENNNEVQQESPKQENDEASS